MDDSEAERLLCQALQEQLQTYGRVQSMVQRLALASPKDAHAAPKLTAILLREINDLESRTVPIRADWLALGRKLSPCVQSLLVRVRAAILRLMNSVVDLEKGLQERLGTLSGDLETSLRALKMVRAYTGQGLPI